MSEEARSLPQITIGKIAGFARGDRLVRSGPARGPPRHRLGLVNRALPAEEIDASSTPSRARMARVKPEVVAAMKATVDTVAPGIPLAAYAVENASLYSLFTPDRSEMAHRQLAAGVQTREGERDLEGLMDRL